MLHRCARFVAYFARIVWQYRLHVPPCGCCGGAGAYRGWCCEVCHGTGKEQQ